VTEKVQGNSGSSYEGFGVRSKIFTGVIHKKVGPIKCEIRIKINRERFPISIGRTFGFRLRGQSDEIS